MGQSQATKIFIKSYDFGFYTSRNITAQRFELTEDGPELVWCNHAGAVEEITEHEDVNPDGTDRVWHTTTLNCDKCGAYKIEGLPYWDNAPYEGLHDELG